jgi:hypothetical protein
MSVCVFTSLVYSWTTLAVPDELLARLQQLDCCSTVRYSSSISNSSSRDLQFAASNKFWVTHPTER